MSNQRGASADGTGQLDVAQALGADPTTSEQCFTIYIPNKDQHGNAIGNQRKWVLEAINLLATIGGGATAMPPVEGAWFNDAGTLIWEQPVVVYSYIDPDRFLSQLPTLRAFLHRMGHEADQGEVAVVLGDRF